MKRMKNKHGLALESAVLFMVLIFALCTLLTTFALVGNTRAKLTENALLERVAIEQILEDFLADPMALESGERGDYTYAVIPGEGGEEIALAVYRKAQDTESLRLCAKAVLVEGRWCLTEYKTE